MVLLPPLLAGPEEESPLFFGAGAAGLLLDEQAASEKVAHSVSPIATFRKVRCLDRVFWSVAWSVAWSRLIEGSSVPTWSWMTMWRPIDRFPMAAGGERPRSPMFVQV